MSQVLPGQDYLRQPSIRGLGDPENKLDVSDLLTQLNRTVKRRASPQSVAALQGRAASRSQCIQVYSRLGQTLKCKASLHVSSAHDLDAPVTEQDPAGPSQDRPRPTRHVLRLPFVYKKLWSNKFN